MVTQSSVHTTGENHPPRPSPAHCLGSDNTQSCVNIRSPPLSRTHPLTLLKCTSFRYQSAFEPLQPAATSRRVLSELELLERMLEDVPLLLSGWGSMTFCSSSRCHCGPSGPDHGFSRGRTTRWRLIAADDAAAERGGGSRAGGLDRL